MILDARIAIASGVSLILADGWQFEAAGTSSKSFEIIMRKGEVEACLRLISLGGHFTDVGFDQFRYDLLNSLASLGCLIDPVDKDLKHLISATQPDSHVRIIHYLRKNEPMIHLSAAGISIKKQIDELIVMTDSIEITNIDFAEGRKVEFGQLIPFQLNDEFWKT